MVLTHLHEHDEHLAASNICMQLVAVLYSFHWHEYTCMQSGPVKYEVQ